jgi:1-deoxy-D-xylulose-5-phosphate reductoisomerase
VPVPTLDLAEVGSLTFEPPDEETFACLRLAREAGKAGGTAPCVLNAANEVAVGAFLAGRLPFLAIAAVIETTLERVGTGRVHSFETLYDADAQARAVAADLVAEGAART